jgi:hypothetical protein
VREAISEGMRVRSLLSGRVGTVSKVGKEGWTCWVKWDDGKVAGMTAREDVEEISALEQLAEQAE